MDNYEKWEEEGSEDTYQKANKVWKQMLKDYEAPALDEAIAEELQAFVAHRRAEIQAGVNLGLSGSDRPKMTIRPQPEMVDLSRFPPSRLGVSDL